MSNIKTKSPNSLRSSAPFDKRGPRQNVFSSPFVKGESPEGEGDFYKYLLDEHGRAKNGNLKYLEELRKIARHNRNNPTKAELIFWDKVLKYDNSGYRFLRQKPLNRFILDFYCPRLLLAIEIDGDSHDNKKYLDRERDLFLEKYKIKTIRFTNKEVFENLEEIKIKLGEKIKEREKIIFIKKVPLFVPAAAGQAPGKAPRRCGGKGI